MPRRRVRKPFTVRAPCPDCGPVDVPAPQVIVRIYTATGTITFALVCPNCSNPVGDSCTTGIAQRMAAIGVTVERWHRPPVATDDPPVTMSDIRRFRELLHDHERFNAAVTSLK